jgi:hypothetical protein
VRNQNYGKEVRGDSDEEKVNVQSLVDRFTKLGFKDMYGGTESFVQKNKTKGEMIGLLKEGKQLGVFTTHLLFNYYVFISK